METILEPTKAATMPSNKIKDIALGILFFETDSDAANLYCWAKEAERPIDKFPRENKMKLSIDIPYAQIIDDRLFNIDAKAKPNLLPLNSINLDAKRDPAAVPTIIRAVGKVTK